MNVKKTTEYRFLLVNNKGLIILDAWIEIALPAGVGEDGVCPELGEVGVEDGEPP